MESNTTDVREVVREKYGQAALRVTSGGSSCCGGRAAVEECCDPITSNLYGAAQTGELPRKSRAGIAGLREPDGAGGAQGR